MCQAGQVCAKAFENPDFDSSHFDNFLNGAFMGLRVGTYTSPHLESATERIRVDAESIPDEDFGMAVGDIARVAEAHELDLTASLPDNAVDSVYRSGEEELWLDPDDSTAIYLVTLDRTERLPMGEQILCE